MNIRNERTFTFTCLLLSTFTFTGEHKKREGRKPGSRLWQSDLHNKKARAQRQPSEHRSRDFATSERSDLQQKDESNVAEGKHWPDQPRGEVRDLLPICPWISKGGMLISVTISSRKYQKGVSSIFVPNIQRRLKNRKQRLVPTERTPFWLLPAFFTSWHFYFLPYLTFLLVTGLTLVSIFNLNLNLQQWAGLFNKLETIFSWRKTWTRTSRDSSYKVPDQHQHLHI